MTLNHLVDWSCDKNRFQKLDDFSTFCEYYLEFIQNNLQAVIVSQNETNYRFFQYRADGFYNITRPINSDLMISADSFHHKRQLFYNSLTHIRDITEDTDARTNINRFIYTCQQAIGATLDALPSGRSNTARKINGDLFERYMRLLISHIGIDVCDGTICLPISINGEHQFDMKYQHDLILKQDNQIKAIGSVKTSSKDRLDKIFIDKFLYNRLSGSDTPHFAVFLNDVQRKGKEPNYGINTTFLTGHFKGYTVKLNPLDGVYYCDLRPQMKTDTLLQQHIRSLDYLLAEDIWNYISD